MGRILSSVRIENVADPSKSIRCDALVDTGASHLVLPSAWKERLGELELIETVELETANQAHVQGEIWGPVKVQVEGFRHTYTEVMFIDMNPEDGSYEPLIGYIILEQAQIAVDMVRHKLMKAKRLDLKSIRNSSIRAT
jgi:predicted aspartyl protease